VRLRMTAAVMAGIALGIAGVSSVALAVPVAIKAKHPKIVAKPHSVTVNKFTTLNGSGFKPHSKFVLNECSAKSWVVPRKVCNHRNAVHVRTGPRGGFRVRMKALLCPRPVQPQGRTLGPKPFIVHCFIGKPTRRGANTETLVGAVRISVTGP
jgi:hypothetical protein